MRREAASLMREGLRGFVEGIRLTIRASGARPDLDAAQVSALVARAWNEELLSGYRDDPSRILKPIPAGRPGALVAARDIEFTSICRHHLLPFSGVVHIVYAPREALAGFSSLGRLVDCLSRRLQLQEDLTREIAESLQDRLDPAGAACLVEAAHACMTGRGTRKAHSRVVTAAFTGSFRIRAAARRQALALLGSRPRPPRRR